MQPAYARARALQREMDLLYKELDEVPWDAPNERRMIVQELQEIERELFMCGIPPEEM